MTPGPLIGQTKYVFEKIEVVFFQGEEAYLIESEGYSAILCSWEPVEFDNSTDFEGNWYDDYGNWTGTTDDWYGDGGSWNGSSVPWWAMSSTTTSPPDPGRKRRQVNLNLPKKRLSKIQNKKTNKLK